MTDHHKYTAEDFDSARAWYDAPADEMDPIDRVVSAALRIAASLTRPGTLEAALEREFPTNISIGIKAQRIRDAMAGNIT